MMKKPTKDQTLELKTCVLKVSIDCEGCKKRIQKVLGGVEGVYATVVDAEHNKVTVTGDVDADKLIKRLAKSGKHAEFIPPEEKKENNKKQSNNAKQSNPKNHGGERKADTATAEDLKTDGDVGKQRKSKKKEKQSGAPTTTVGSPVSTLPPLDQTGLPVNYGMSYGTEPVMVGVLDQIRNVDEHEDEQSSCFIM